MGPTLVILVTGWTGKLTAALIRNIWQELSNSGVKEDLLKVRFTVAVIPTVYQTLNRVCGDVMLWRLGVAGHITVKHPILKVRGSL